MANFDTFEKVVYDNDYEHFTSLVKDLEDINLQNKYGWTLLHITIRRNRGDMLNFLLDNGADINKVDGVGWTPLMEAIMDDMPTLVSVLVDRGADKTIVNARGATALMLAQKFGRVAMFDTLS
jgi:ankyrin repeat protein